MKKFLITSLLFVSALVSTQVMAGTGTSDDIISNPNDSKSQQENVKKSGANKYNFTLFNFFGTSSTNKSDSSTTILHEPKELNEDLHPKIAL